MPTLPDDEYFDRRWLHSSTQEHTAQVAVDLNDVREFAYKSFDDLDADRNGYLTRVELLKTLEHGDLDNRESSFIMFLLNNHEQIVEMNEDSKPEQADGISREDIELYFKLIANIL
jgi:hypothetical protein